MLNSILNRDGYLKFGWALGFSAKGRGGGERKGETGGVKKGREEKSERV